MSRSEISNNGLVRIAGFYSDKYWKHLTLFAFDLF